MGEIDVTLTVVQIGSALNGTMLDTILNWIKTNLTANLPTGAGWTLTTQIAATLTQYTVTIRITDPNITVTGTLYDQVLAWLKTYATGPLPPNYVMTISINIIT